MQQFKSMTELVEYLGSLEGRVRAIETENANLWGIQSRQENVDGNAFGRYVAQDSRRICLCSKKFN